MYERRVAAGHPPIVSGDRLHRRVDRWLGADEARVAVGPERRMMTLTRQHVLEQPVGIIASNRAPSTRHPGIQETLRKNADMPISVQDRKRLWGRRLAAAPSRTAARNSSKR